MKNFLRTILLATVIVLAACSDDKDNSADHSSKELIAYQFTVVTAVEDNVAVKKITDFFEEGDLIGFKYNHKNGSTVSFFSEWEDDAWTDLSAETLYGDVYPGGVEPESFTAEFGKTGLTTDQSTEEKFHAAHYIKGDVTLNVKTSNVQIVADSMHNQHIQIIVKVLKSNHWHNTSDFESIVGEGALTIHTSAGEQVKPLYSTSQEDCSTYSAILPVGKVPASGSPIFTIEGQTPVAYTLINNTSAPVAGQTLLVTAYYNGIDLPEPTAYTKDLWDTSEGLIYGYPLIDKIRTKGDWRLFAASVSAGNSYKEVTVQLMNDIDFEGEIVETVGDFFHPFQGTFRGDNKTMKGFVVNRKADHTGLFGSIGVDGTVKDLLIKDASVQTSNSYVSLLAGSNYGYIINCHTSDNTIVGSNYAASIVGYNDGNVVGCGMTNDEIYTIKSSSAIAGGIAGYNFRNIIACKALPVTVEVTRSSGNSFGAIVGENAQKGTMKSCAWQHSTLSAGGTGYGLDVANSSNAQMNEAISSYNSEQTAGGDRICDYRW